MGDFEPRYSAVNSLSTNEDDDALDELPNDNDAITDNDQNNLICEIYLHAVHYRLCKAKAVHDAVLENNDAPLAKKTPTATEARTWIQKLQLRN